MTIGKYSLGTGDRFGKEGAAQVAAFEKIKADGVDVDIVWNKSNREHTIIGTSPADQRKAADDAIAKTGWKGQYFVDADHINMTNADWFIDVCDFFTIDITDLIGKETTEENAAAFLERTKPLLGEHKVPGQDAPIVVTEEVLEKLAHRYLYGLEDAKRLYDRVVEKGGNIRHVELAMDESPERQGPADLLVILSEVAHEQLPIDTVAVKFVGRFNKGVDYDGDVDEFLAEFRADVAVIQYAIAKWGLHKNLKLSVHTGSDKFSLYPGMGAIVREFDTGLHLKTAGTTWLEELIGLAEGGGEGLTIAKEIYRTAYGMQDELVGPYADVIDIDPAQLPNPDEVDSWDSKQFADALRHDQSNPAYNKNLRQLLHISFKLAAKMGDRYLNALDEHREHVERNVTENLYERHLKPLFEA
ncbi:tagaturonate epimerase family protein [Propionimicrobium sp. PCR01-08-3]|uniref:tagaturonate epimerase family protein n=1 Tax=Propionimicrobium sp. PCR01-08-3 TaxID=3052086 RepID=UPI00255C81AC|nr:tagaturonate epimerase family protein [Propionimicrobium sp. PCR01-08-3]WIY83596.1 tagaturonate epimerase family protein [Propionimicrobium sp. PCR01-08-3]